MKINKERILDYCVLAALMTIFCSLFDFSLAFTNTHVAGGDMISHPWISKSLKDQWSQGLFWSWNNGWFAGFPFLYFYFYPLYIIAVLLEKAGLNEAVAFKSTVLFVVCSVPFFYYTVARRWLSIPLATLLAALGTAIFLNELDSRWGGNFKSLLAGQMSHQFGLVMMVCFFGYLANSQTNKIGAIFFLTLSILSHVYSGLYAFLLLLCFLLSIFLKTKSTSQVLSYTKGPLISLGLSSFFWAPFLYYRKNTVAPINHTSVDFSEVVRVLQLTHPLYLLLYIGSIVLIVLNYKKKKDWLFSATVFALIVASALAMPILEGTPLLHIRLPAEIYLISMLTLILGIKMLNIPRSIEWSAIGLASVLVLQSFYPSINLDQSLPHQLRAGVKDIPFWWKWNMSGIEEKPNITDVQEVWGYLKNIDDNEGRVAVEYGDYNAYGSPRIFELTPYMTGKPVMEGLLLESSPTYPTYFYISFHFNSTTWWPGFPVTVPERDVQKGIKYFGLFNVKYFVAFDAKTKADLDQLKTPVLFENKAFKIYKINADSRIANRVVGDVPVIESKNPLMQTVLNYPESLDKFVEIKPGRTVSENLIKTAPGTATQLIPIDGSWSRDGQSYTVKETGASPSSPQKILFKISHFPNWVSDTGEDVRLVTPNLMMVETKNPTLSLTYRAGIIEHMSLFISILSLAVLIWLKTKECKTKYLSGRTHFG